MMSSPDVSPKHGVDEERRLVDGAKETRVNRQKNAAVTSRSSDGSHPLSPGVSPPRQNYIPETIVESDDECEEEDGVEEPAAFHQPLLVDSRTSTRDPLLPHDIHLEPRPQQLAMSSPSEPPSATLVLPPLQHPGGVPTSRALTVESLSHHTPFEDEAEAYLMSTLDETNPTTQALSGLSIAPSKQSILSDDAFSTSTFRRDGRAARHQLPLHSFAMDAKLTSTAENLFQLTKQMQQLDIGLSALEPKKATDTKSFADTAAGILKHRKVSIDETPPVSDAREGDAASAPTQTEDRTLNLAERMARLNNLSIENASDGRDGSVNAANGASLLKVSIVSTVPDQTLRDNADVKVAVSKISLSVSSSSHSSESSGSSDDYLEVTERERLNLLAPKSEFQRFEEWFRFKRVGMLTFAKYVFLFSILPSLAVASILFYAVGNPPCHINLQCSPRKTDDPTLDYLGSASASWWLLFLLCRQMITFTLAYALEDIFVDYFALRSGWGVRMFGPLLTLLIIQSDGWPCVVFFWGVFDLSLLYGQHPFAQHWLFYQEAISLMNGQNPSGNIPSSSPYKFVVITAIVLSVVVSIKRVWLSFVLGRVTFKRYSEELARVMSQSILVGKVAGLARDIARSNLCYDNLDLPKTPTAYNLVDEEKQSESNGLTAGSAATEGSTKKPAALRRNLFAGVDESGVKLQIDGLLGEWEEPEAKQELDDKPTIASIAQFRQSTAYLNTLLPFGAAFGPATTRQEVIGASEKLYNNLMLSVPHRDVLTFDVIALLAVQGNGELDLELMRSLIKLFRPDRDGNLSLLDFAKSIDTCYKELRVLRASISNSSKMDESFESLFNFFFYIVVIFIILAVAGIDPFALWASVSAFIASIAFIIGGGCAAYFQGLMMVFLRRPFDIGDKIATSQPYTDTSTTGSYTWIVKDMNLYSTTVIYGSTNEVATYSNGALSTLRIINATRSPQASLSFTLKFAIDIPFASIQIFKTAIEKFIKARPREWVRFSCFRVSLVDAENGFVQYSVGGIHRESWHNATALGNSKADLQAFATELSKQMGMRYEAPPMPVHLTLRSSAGAASSAPLSLPQLDHDDAPAVDSAREAHGLKAAQAAAALFGTDLSPFSSRSEEP